MLHKPASVMLRSYILLICLYHSEASGCDYNKFGERCQFNCHCEGLKCDHSGHCMDGSDCQAGFFGHLCQYEDLAYKSSSTHPELFDGDDLTCLVFNMNITNVRLDDHYPLSFIRVETYGNEEARQLYLEAISKDNTSKLVCVRGRLVSRYRYEFDYYCQLPDSAKIIDIYWMSSMTVCSVRISGGRPIWSYSSSKTEHGPHRRFHIEELKVASRDKTTTTPTTTTPAAATSRAKSSTATITATSTASSTTLATEALTSPAFSPWPLGTTSDQAKIKRSHIDPAEPGDLDNTRWQAYKEMDQEDISHSQKHLLHIDELDYLCFTPNSRTTLYVTLHLSQPLLIYRLHVTVINNGAESNSFSLTFYDDSHQPVFSATRETEEFLNVARISWPNSTFIPIKTVSLFRTLPMKFSPYAICDITIFGDCVPSRYGMLCDRTCQNICGDAGCDMASGFCLICDDDNPRECPEDKKMSCGNFKYGPDCKYDCGTCFHGKCNRKTGECLRQCDTHLPCNSTNLCPQFFYGPVCKLVCEFCLLGDCNHETGACRRGCVLGHFGDFCNYTCSDNCKEGKCDSRTLECILGCKERYAGPQCDSVCSENCAGEGKCDQFNRSCLKGCLNGYSDDQCVQPVKSKMVIVLLVVGFLLTMFVVIMCMDETLF